MLFLKTFKWTVLVALFLSIFGTKVWGSIYIMQFGSKESYQSAILNRTHVQGSSIVCAASCNITDGCSSYKLENEDCLLLNGSQIRKPKPDENPIKFFLDVSLNPIDGGWSDWSEFGNCSVTCGLGTWSRSRTCNKPEPQFFGEDCPGDNSTSENCSINERCVNSLDLDIIGIGEFKEEENICPGPQSFVTSHKLRTSIENGNQNLMGIRVECSDGTPLSSGNLTSGAQYEPLDCPNGYNAATIHQLEMYDLNTPFLKLRCVNDNHWDPSSNSSQSDFCPQDGLICGFNTTLSSDSTDSQGPRTYFTLLCCLNEL